MNLAGFQRPVASGFASRGVGFEYSVLRMAININDPEAKALIASRLDGLKFDIEGMTAAAKVVTDLIKTGQIVTNCPHACGGAG